MDMVTSNQRFASTQSLQPPEAGLPLTPPRGEEL
jgi:hypothetical protein